MRENTDQKDKQIWTILTQCLEFAFYSCSGYNSEKRTCQFLFLATIYSLPS